MESKKHRFPYKWTLKDSVFTKDKGKVFSCFSCGGGSSFGYKLAGFDVIGCNEIDPKMMEAYKTNHNPKYAYLEPIQTFKLRATKEESIKRFGSIENYELSGGDDKWLMPQELYELDILDGSPPCSSFSMAGNREKDWGKEKKFREGQAEQVLDNLFFDFIDLAKKLQPKVVVAENVKGLLMGNAKEYVRRIYREFDLAGYYCQHWLLDASKMGVPQRRERVFFIAMRKDLAKQFLYQQDMFTILPKLNIYFNEPEIPFGDFKDENGRELSDNMKKVWEDRIYGDSDMRAAYFREFKKDKYFSQNFIYSNEVSKTITSHEDSLVLFDSPRYTSTNEVCQIGSFPLDYKFNSTKPHYLIGMSVPPIMVAQLSEQIYLQWLSKL